MAGKRWQFNNCLSEVGSVGEFTNLIFDNCCCNVTCEITNVWGNKLTFDGITIPFAVVGYNVTVISQPSAGTIVNSGDSISITIQICNTSGPQINSLCQINVSSQEYGDEAHSFTFGSATAIITPNSPSLIDFGNIVFGSTSTTSQICITNLATICSAEFEFSGCVDVGIDGIPANIIIDAVGGSNNQCLDLTWTPTEPCLNLSCELTISVCGNVIQTISITGTTTDAEGNPCGDICPCLCCTGIEIQSEDGRCVDNVDLTCDDSTTYSDSAIGEKKSVVWSFHYDTGIGNNFERYFNPIVWAVTCNYSTKYGGPINSPPPYGYYFEFFASMIGGTWQTMSLFNTGSNTPNQKNWIVECRLINSTDFEVRLTMFLISDLEDWISAAVFNNAPKWRRNHVFASIPPLSGPLQNTFPSVYNSNRKLCSLFWIHDPNRIVPSTGNEFECYEIKSINWTSRFFNKGLYNGPSEFLNPLFTFERGGNPVSNLSTIQKTEVKFYINVPSSFGGLSCVYFNLFDESTTDNTVDFLTNYNNSRSEITNIGSISVLDNLLESPSSVTPLGGDDYEITAFVGTGLNVSHQYRIFSVVYATDGMVNSFISDPLTVTNIPTPDCENCFIETVSTWDQIFRNTESDCLKPVSKERIRHNVIFSEGTLKNCFGRSFEWLDYVVSLTLNVYRRATDFPVSGKTTFFMFNQEVSTRVVGYPFNWNNTGNLIVQDSGTDIVSEFTRRVGFETTPFAGSNVYIANTATYINRTPAGVLGTPYVTTLGVTNNWRNEQIIYEYILKLDLSPLYSTPYEINYVKAFQVLAIENEPDNSGFAVVIESFVFEGNSGGVWTEITGPFCPNDFDSIRATYTANQEGNFAFFATPVNGSVSNVKESEDDAFNLPQLLNVVSLDLNYSPSGPNYEAVAILDPSTLTTGISYELCGYWSAI